MSLQAEPARTRSCTRLLYDIITKARIPTSTARISHAIFALRKIAVGMAEVSHSNFSAANGGGIRDRRGRRVELGGKSFILFFSLSTPKPPLFCPYSSRCPP